MPSWPLLVGAGPGLGVGAPKRGWDELRSAPGGPPGYPDTGEEVSKPLNWAEVYIWGVLLVAMVSGRAPKALDMGRLPRKEPGCSLFRAKESMKPRCEAWGVEPK